MAAYDRKRIEWHDRVRTTAMVLSVLIAALSVALLSGCSTYGGQAVKVSPVTTGPSGTAPAAKAKGLVQGDVKISLKIKSKQCFGDAGCNLVVRPEVHLYKDPGKDQTYEITFKVYGGDSGPVTETVTLTGRNSVSYTDIPLGTTNPGTKITAKVTDVEKWAY